MIMSERSSVSAWEEKDCSKEWRKLKKGVATWAWQADECVWNSSHPPPFVTLRITALHRLRLVLACIKLHRPDVIQPRFIIWIQKSSKNVAHLQGRVHYGILFRGTWTDVRYAIYLNSVVVGGLLTKMFVPEFYSGDSAKSYGDPPNTKINVAVGKSECTHPLVFLFFPPFNFLKKVDERVYHYKFIATLKMFSPRPPPVRMYAPLQFPWLTTTLRQT